MKRLLGLMWGVCLLVLPEAQAGSWRLRQGPVFSGQEEWTSGDWTRRVDSRSQNDVQATVRTKNGRNVLSVKSEWIAPPATIQAGEVVPLPGKATVLKFMNPDNLGFSPSVSCFIKSPYAPFWESGLPLKPGGTLNLKNTQLQAPNGQRGNNLTVVYRLLGLGAALDFEYTYGWSEEGGSLGPEKKDLLGRAWDQTEGAWKGSWNRRGTSNIFDAVWTRDNLRITAVLTIEIDGTKVVVKRRQSSDGADFDYTGTVSADAASVIGEYKLRGNNYSWSANIRM